MPQTSASSLLAGWGVRPTERTTRSNSSVWMGRLRHISDFQVTGLRVLRHPGDHGTDKTHPLGLFGPLVIAVKAFALGPESMKKMVGATLCIMFPGDDGLLGGVHAAHVGAVFPADGGIPGADALNPGDSLGLGLSLGRRTWPAQGPVAESRRSNSREVMTLA